MESAVDFARRRVVEIAARIARESTAGMLGKSRDDVVPLWRSKLGSAEVDYEDFTTLVRAVFDLKEAVSQEID